MILKKKNLKFKSLLIGGIIFLLSTLALGYFILSRKRIYVKFSEKSSSKPTKTEILEDINQKFVALETILKDPKIGI